MIKQNTVFILGAGALVKNNPGFSDNDIEAMAGRAQSFCNTFFKSSTSSIDLFLARNMQYADIGKRAIVSSILEAEKKSTFREKMPEKNKNQDWYSYLFKERGTMGTGNYGDVVTEMEK